MLGRFFNIRTSTLLIVAAIVGGFFVRFYGLSEYAFGDDELWHLVVAKQNSIIDVIKVNFAEEVHPPLSYIIWYLMLKISDNDLWLRMSAIVPSLLLIPSIYVFAKLNIGRFSGYFLVLLFAFAAMPVTIGTAIRSYPLMMLALIWAAIFLHKYCHKLDVDVRCRRLYLAYYFGCCLIAMQLNHSSAIVIFAFGLILSVKSFFEKNYKDLVVIVLMHLVLVVLFVGYFYILFNFFDFEPLDGYFIIISLSMYLLNYIYLFSGFVGADLFNNIADLLILLFIFISQVMAVIFLVKNKKWALMTLAFLPFVLLVGLDYLRIYPFSGILRNNLFLFFTVIIIFGCGFERIAKEKFFKELVNLIKKKEVALKIFIILLVVFLVLINLHKNSFRNFEPYCYEFVISKKDRELLNSQINKLNIKGNIFVTPLRNMWYFRYYNDDKKFITVLNENLAKYDDGKIIIYFTAKPAINSSIMLSLYDYQILFKNLFEYLLQQNSLDELKYVTFFDIGLAHEYMMSNFHPQFIKSEKLIAKDNDKLQCIYDISFDHDNDSYDFFWKLHLSNGVTNKFYKSNLDFACGREMLLFSMTPQFIKNEILNRNLTDLKKVTKQCLMK